MSASKCIALTGVVGLLVHFQGCSSKGANVACPDYSHEGATAKAEIDSKTGYVTITQIEVEKNAHCLQTPLENDYSEKLSERTPDQTCEEATGYVVNRLMAQCIRGDSTELSKYTQSTSGKSCKKAYRAMSKDTGISFAINASYFRKQGKVTRNGKSVTAKEYILLESIECKRPSSTTSQTVDVLKHNIKFQALGGRNSNSCDATLRNIHDKLATFCEYTNSEAGIEYLKELSAASVSPSEHQKLRRQIKELNAKIEKLESEASKGATDAEKALKKAAVESAKKELEEMKKVEEAQLKELLQRLTEMHIKDKLDLKASIEGDIKKNETEMKTLEDSLKKTAAAAEQEKLKSEIEALTNTTKTRKQQVLDLTNRLTASEKVREEAAKKEAEEKAAAAKKLAEEQAKK